MKTEYERALKLRRSMFTYQSFVEERREQAKQLFIAYAMENGSYFTEDNIEFAMNEATAIAPYFSNYGTDYTTSLVTSNIIEQLLKAKMPYLLMPKSCITILASGTYPLLNKSIFEFMKTDAEFYFFGGVYGDKHDPYFLKQEQAYRTLSEQISFYYNMTNDLFSENECGNDKKLSYVSFCQSGYSYYLKPRH